MATLDVLQECPELWPVMTKTFVQAVAAAVTHSAYAAGVADEKARAAAALER